MSLPIINSNVFGQSPANAFVESPCKERFNPNPGRFLILAIDMLFPGSTIQISQPPITNDMLGNGDGETFFASAAQSLASGSFSIPFWNGPPGYGGFVDFFGFPFARVIFNVKGFCELADRSITDSTLVRPEFYIVIAGGASTPSFPILINEDVSGVGGDGVMAIDRNVTLSYKFSSAIDWALRAGNIGSHTTKTTVRYRGTYAGFNPGLQVGRCYRNSGLINNIGINLAETGIDPSDPFQLKAIQALQVSVVGFREATSLAPYDYLTLGDQIGVTVRDNVTPH